MELIDPITQGIYNGVRIGTMLRETAQQQQQINLHRQQIDQQRQRDEANRDQQRFERSQSILATKEKLLASGARVATPDDEAELTLGYRMNADPRNPVFEKSGLKQQVAQFEGDKYILPTAENLQERMLEGQRKASDQKLSEHDLFLQKFGIDVTSPEGKTYRVLPADADNLYDKFHPATEPPPNLHIVPSINNAGDQTITAINPRTGKIEGTPIVQPGVGKKARPLAAAGAGGSETDPKLIAQAIIDGKQTPEMTGLYRTGAAVRTELAKKGYDLAGAQRDYRAVQRHLATLNGPQQERLRQAVDFTSDSIDQIEGLYKEWQTLGGATGIRLFNKAALSGAKNLPGRAGEVATSLEAQINDLTAELATVYKGGNGSTDESLKLAAANLKADWNPQTFTRAVSQIRTNLQIRRNSILNSHPAGVGENSPYLPPQQGGGGGAAVDLSKFERK